MSKETFTIVRVGYRILDIKADSLEDALDEAPNHAFPGEHASEYQGFLEFCEKKTS